jgi:DNA-directed RNA polymerase specialized sigma subunit
MSTKELIELNKSVINKNYQRRIKNIILTNYYNNDESIKNLITIATTEFNNDLKDELFKYYESELNKEKCYYQYHGDEIRIANDYIDENNEISQEEIDISLKIYKDMKLFQEERDRAFGLKNAIEKLDINDRYLIQMLYFDGFSTRDVAKKLFLQKTQIIRKRNKILKKIAKMMK